VQNHSAECIEAFRNIGFAVPIAPKKGVTNNRIIMNILLKNILIEFFRKFLNSKIANKHI
jgi:hypothetical protein